LTFDESPHGDFAFTGDHGVGFPMAELLALVDALGLLSMETRPGIWFLACLRCGRKRDVAGVSNEVRDQISGLNVNPLVDGFGPMVCLDVGSSNDPK